MGGGAPAEDRDARQRLSRLVGRLTVDAINPEVDEGWPRLLSAFAFVKWDLTCGFCRMRFGSAGRAWRESVVCPACGTRNLLAYRPGPSEPER